MPETFAPSNDNMSFGAGACYFDPFDAAGDPTGYFHLGEVSELIPRPTDDIKEHYEHMTPARGLYATALAQRKLEVDLTLWELNRKNFSLGTAGEETLFTQGGSTITGEQLAASLALGAVYTTAERQISAYAVKQGATTLVEGTDYEVVDANAGMIHILPDGAATEAAAVTIDYTSAAIAGSAQKTIAIYNKPQIEGRFLFLGNPVKGPKRELRLWHVAFNPKELGSLISDDFISAGLTMSVYSDLAGQHGGSAQFPLGIVFERG